HGTDLLAEVALPDAAGEDGDRFGIHPALLDAALHPFLLNGGADAPPAGEGDMWLPFAWSGVSLHAAGATTVRVRLQPREQDGGRELGIVVADAAGAPVLSVESIVMRPADSSRLTAARRQSTDGLFSLEWTSLP
ncbi:polyketide synthase dehydratase domain-containing protein, partial [Streptomyces sp. MCAF7]